MTCVSASFAVGARCQIRLRPLTLPKRKRKPTRHTLAAGIPPADFDRYSQEWLATCEPHTADRLPIEWALKLQRHTIRLSPIVDEIQICHKPAFLSRCPRIISKRQVAAILLGL